MSQKQSKREKRRTKEQAVLDGHDTFSILNPNPYSKDKNHAYFGVLKIEGADPAFFRTFNRYFSTDAERIFFEGRMIGRDTDGFTVFEFSKYAKNKDQVYWEDKILDDADSETFEKIKDLRFFSRFAKDKNSVYWAEKRLVGSDPKTFKVIGDSHGKDKSSVFHRSEKIIGADPNTFELVSGMFEGTLGKDKNKKIIKLSLIF